MAKLERLDKCVSKLTGLSRLNASSLIKDGVVLVDGAVITDKSYKVSDDQNIEVEGFEGFESSVSDIFKKRVFMLNKPADFVCADRDKNHRVVVDLFLDELYKEKLHCVGRLDCDVTGLLLVTDDGDLIHEVTAPKANIKKTYIAITDKKIPEKAVEAFFKGIKHPEEKKRYKSAILEILSDNVGKVTVTEGRYHEVKRLFEMVGVNVISLERISIGELTLDEDLALGEYRLLDDSEIALIFK